MFFHVQCFVSYIKLVNGCPTTSKSEDLKKESQENKNTYKKCTNFHLEILTAWPGFGFSITVIISYMTCIHLNWQYFDGNEALISFQQVSIRFQTKCVGQTTQGSWEDCHGAFLLLPMIWNTSDVPRKTKLFKLKLFSDLTIIIVIAPSRIMWKALVLVFGVILGE